MIQANELRIGNWIHNNVESLQVTADDICLLSKDMEGYFNCSPIPLTEEWIIKLGFEIQPKDDFEEYNTYECGYGKNYMRISVSDDDKDVLLFFNAHFMGYYLIADVNTVGFVHQLQNLYFALIGKEVAIPDKG